jgi:hypothetical protein
MGLQLHLKKKTTWYFDSTDVLSCFLGTNLQFCLPGTTTGSRFQRPDESIITLNPVYKSSFDSIMERVQYFCVELSIRSLNVRTQQVWRVIDITDHLEQILGEHDL